MLHRLTLRVLPRLTRAVTEEPVRRRKRLMMLVPGLAAFAVYRAVKQIDPLSDPFVLLALSGLVSAITALWAYRMGRQAGFATLWSEDGPRMLGWLTGWIGFVYGVQLSLMVLALLNIFVGYDFLRHPDGPAMMAIIIACTSVARDAFEIGHVRRLQKQGESFLTFPDGTALRMLIRAQPGRVARWAFLAAAGGAVTAVCLASLWNNWSFGRSDLAEFVFVTVVAGSLAVWAYLRGEQRPGGWRAMLGSIGWAELFQFWWWPGLAFAATYFLVLWGAAVFLLRVEAMNASAYGVIAGLVAGLMALYGYYLGYRRQLENRIEQTVPQSLLRCPFVFGILSKTKPVSSQESVSPRGAALEDGRRA
ncbi:MAG TPA: hypothetical protein VGQ60_04355 [Nitrospiraceae bacterium]|jgi:hypothetical protein|nr:hypothetical protein [Nitrospiraceae bacterium]